MTFLPGMLVPHNNSLMTVLACISMNAVVLGCYAAGISFGWSLFG